MTTALTPRVGGTSISRNRTMLFELYASDHFPDAGGFDPVNAVALWAKTSLTWQGHAYARRILAFDKIAQHMSGQFDGINLTIDNADRFLATFILTNTIYGMRLVCRYINIDLSTALADSVVCFVGRLDAPDNKDIERDRGQLSAKEELASLDIETPKRRVQPEDPLGRSPNDLLYEGYTFNARPSQVKFIETTTQRTFLIFLKKKDVVKYNQWSSETGSAADQIVPLVLGRVQLDGLPVFWVDIGFFIVGIWVFAAHKVTSINNFQLPDSSYVFYSGWATTTQQQAHVHLGDPGGTGTNATPDTIEGQYPQNTALLSRSAYVGFAIGGPETATQPFANPTMDAVPTLVSIVRGEADLPDGGGVFNQKGFTDCPVYLTRLVMTSSDFFGLDSRLINDTNLPAVHAERQRPIVDKSNGELLYMQGYDVRSLADGEIVRFNSTGLRSPAYFKHVVNPSNPDPTKTSRTDAVAINLDVGQCAPGEVWNPITETCETATPITPVVPIQKLFRHAYTLNVPLTDTVNAVDFLNNVVLPTGRLYLVKDSAGRYDIRAKKASDSAYLISSASIGATTIQIADIEPWRTSTQGYVLIAPGLTTSEYRKVTSAVYNAATGNAITLAVSSPGTTLSASGTTLAGGNSTTPSSGTVTVTGTGTPGDVVIVTVWGIPVTYIVATADTVESIAGVLATSINADPNLRQYVRASWVSTAVMTIYSKVGTLGFAAALVNAHADQIDPPVTAPTATTTTSGTLTPGVYSLGYTFVDGSGNETIMSPLKAVTIASGQKVSVSTVSLPSSASSINWYFSPAHDDDNVQFYVNNTGGAFTINAVADHDADFPPELNQTGVETIRVMEVFNDKNIIKDSFKWTPSTSQINQVKGEFVDAAQGFKRTPITVNDKAHQRLVRVNKKDINLSAVDNFSQASRLCYATLAEERDGGFRAKWATDDSGIQFEIGDVVAVNDFQAGLVNQPVIIETTELGENYNVSFDARIYSSSLMEGQTGRKTIVVSTSLRFGPIQMSDARAGIDGYGDLIVEAIGHPRVGEEPVEYVMELWDSTFATLKASVPMDIVTAHPCTLGYATLITIH